MPAKFAQPAADALRAVLAFPSTYTVGITSLGYQVVWASLASRTDVDVRRLFTDQGDPPHRQLDLFGLSLSWELDGPVLLDLLEQQRIPLWSHERSDGDPIVFGGGPVLTANPEVLEDTRVQRMVKDRSVPVTRVVFRFCLGLLAYQTSPLYDEERVIIEHGFMR